MKKSILNNVAVSCMSIAVVCLSAYAQTPYCMTSPIGYGSAATGGGAPTASNTVTVSSAADLTSALSGSKSVILLSGAITTSRIECSASNKSIIGLPGAKLVNVTQTKDGSGILHLRSGSNMIIRNIVFVGPGAYDEDGWDCLTNKGCTKLWVDHCEFQDGMDGNFDNTNSADNITVSWCKFTYLKPPKAGGSGGADDHRFTNLVGGSDSDVPADGLYSITWLNCWWANGCVDRMARARNARLDMISCFWNSNNASKNIHLSPGTNGTFVYVDNGVFKCSGDIVNFEKTGNNNVKFVNCTGGGSNTGSVSAPEYSYSPTPAASVAGTVANTSCGAGATLQVTAEGVVSSSCSQTGVTDNNMPEHKTPKVLIGKNGTIDFSASSSENAGITLYSMDGQNVRAFSIKTDAHGNNVHQNVRGLPAGVYMVRIIGSGEAAVIPAVMVR
jgi:pectate lyase